MDQIPVSANQILDGAITDTIVYQDKLLTSFEGSRVELEINKAEGSESTFNKKIFLLTRRYN